jgi:ribonuclease P protein component
MVLFAVRTEGVGRYGVTATRRIGGAVVRARAKRRLRELYRHRQTSTVIQSVDLVANARTSCARVPWAALERDFEDCLERLRARIVVERP